MVYFCVFGNDSMFKLMKIAVDTLSRFGHYADEVLIITDRQSLPILDALSIRELPGVWFHFVDAADMLDFAMAR